MRLAAAALLLVLPLLAACDSSKPPAPAAQAPAAAPAKPAPAASAPMRAAVPVGAQPLLGSFAADLADCGTASALTQVAAGSFKAPGLSCDMALTGNRDGSFTTACGSGTLTLIPVFAPSGEGINLVLPDGKKQTVLRCSR